MLERASHRLMEKPLLLSLFEVGPICGIMFEESAVRGTVTIRRVVQLLVNWKRSTTGWERDSKLEKLDRSPASIWDCGVFGRCDNPPSDAGTHHRQTMRLFRMIAVSWSLWLEICFYLRYLEEPTRNSTLFRLLYETTRAMIGVGLNVSDWSRWTGEPR